jgi:hypothetical protein
MTVNDSANLASLFLLFGCFSQSPTILLIGDADPCLQQPHFTTIDPFCSVYSLQNQKAPLGIMTKTSKGIMPSQSLVIILFLFLLSANLIIMMRPSALSGFIPATYFTESQLINKDTTETSVNITSLIHARIEARMAEFEEKWTQETKKQDSVSAPPVALERREPEQLPTCESLMQAPDSPLADGAFLTRASTPVSWTLRADGSRELKLPHTCRLKRYTSSQARQCLNKKHVSFVGDSLSRYQFVSLAYFIERGEYPPRFGESLPCSHIDENGKPMCSSQIPNVCMEGDWHRFSDDGWKDYHSALGGSTDGGMFHGRLQCGCARGENITWSETTENALYVSDSGIRLSYLGETGWGDWPDPLHGWNFTDCAEKGTCRTTKEDSDRLFARAMALDWDFNEPFYDALNGTLQKILPAVDVAIYNRGHWAVLPEHVAQKVMPLFREWAGNDGRCFYKSTTASPTSHLARGPETGYIKQLAFNVGCGFLDFAHLTQEFELLSYSHPLPPIAKNGTISDFRERSDIFWDSLHFVTWVYEELNNIMLNVLCNGEKFE